MTSQEFKEYYKKNKTVVVGVPIIIVIVLINTFILKPAREKKRLERLGQTQPATTQQATQKADTTVVAPASTAKQPIKMPAPIKQPT
jgi:choline-glycine betaine transporter